MRAGAEQPVACSAPSDGHAQHAILIITIAGAAARCDAPCLLGLSLVGVATPRRPAHASLPAFSATSSSPFLPLLPYN